MDFKISYFNSIFELMAVYNFALLGFEQISQYMTNFSLAISKTIIPDHIRSEIYSTQFPRTFNSNQGWDFDKYRLASYFSRQLLMIEKSSTLFFTKEKNNQIFSPLYFYCGLYCFFIIILGGIAESFPADYVTAKKLFYNFIELFNIITIVPMIVLFFRKAEPIGSRFLLYFLFLVLFHCFASYYVACILTTPQLIDSGVWKQLINIHIGYSSAINLFLIAIFAVSEYFYYFFEFSIPGRKPKIIWKICWNTFFFFILFICGPQLSWKIIQMFPGSMIRVIFESFIICFLPILLFFGRSLFGIGILKLRAELFKAYLMWYFKSNTISFVIPLSEDLSRSKSSLYNEEQEKR